MKKVLNLVLSFTFFLLVNAEVMAKTIEQHEIAEGFGANKELAIRDALSKAVGQASGISISTDSKMITTAVQGQAEVDGNRVSDSSISVAQSSASRVTSEGNIKSYKILNTKKEDGLFVVKVSAIVYKFQASASSSRKRIALMPPKIHQRQYELYKTYPAEKVSDLLANAVERYLVQSRKFAVLTRSDLSAMSAEIALISSDATPAVEKAKLGQLLGSDFILLPELVKAEAKYFEKRIQVTGQLKSWIEGEVTVLLRVISSATGEIKFSEKYSAPASDFSNAENAIGFVASEGVKDLVQRIYPIRVVDVSGDQIVLNAGGNSLREGMIFDVFKEGKKIVDPYTGESLGKTEIKVGEVQVTRVDSKVTYARHINGAQILSGQVLRESVRVNKPKEVEIKRVETGFKAPWD
jgi:curli biogenesis system outer membrane secretion channel CsgG